MADEPFPVGSARAPRRELYSFQLRTESRTPSAGQTLLSTCGFEVDLVPIGMCNTNVLKQLKHLAVILIAPCLSYTDCDNETESDRP